MDHNLYNTRLTNWFIQLYKVVYFSSCETLFGCVEDWGLTRANYFVGFLLCSRSEVEVSSKGEVDGWRGGSITTISEIFLSRVLDNGNSRIFSLHFSKYFSR